MTDFYVYVCFHPLSGMPFYVGKGRRWRITAHRCDLRGNFDRAAVYKLAAELGLDVPAVRVASNLSEHDAFQTEMAYIAAIGRQPNGPLVNKNDGGKGGCNASPDVRQRIAAATRMNMMGRRHRPETIEKFKKAAAGRVPSKACQEARQKALKGKPVPRELAMRRAAWKRGTPHTQEHRAAISTALKGRLPSEATRAAHKLYCEAKSATIANYLCEWCGASFRPNRTGQRFCCKSCSGKHNTRMRLNACYQSQGQPFSD